ncbi:MAG: PhnA domain-containing protein [Phaeodactylibacter sp.]|nr:PhnA domain-containing protein [Phaeodactylibacter sp.]
MSLESDLTSRSKGQCELCGSPENLAPYAVEPMPSDDAAGHIYACATCREQLEDPEKIAPNHWRCLNDSMWSQEPAVQVVAWRMLRKLRAEGWPQALLDMLYLDEETQKWAAALEAAAADAVVHLDSNGAVLEAGDTVVLIKDLNVKGASFVAKRGTAVRRISLVHDNPEHIEGKVNGQQIVILTKFVKKQKA